MFVCVCVCVCVLNTGLADNTPDYVHSVLLVPGIRRVRERVPGKHSMSLAIVLQPMFLCSRIARASSYGTTPES